MLESFSNYLRSAHGPKRSLFAGLLLTVTTLSGPANAMDVALVRNIEPICLNETVINQAYCQGYVSAVVDTLKINQQFDGDGRGNICFPAALSGGELKEIVVAFFQANNLPGDLVAASAIQAAFTQKFPCQE